MIGNDVVDLALARKESDWKRIGFLQKLFTVSEQQLIDAAASPEVMVWNLWSRKEAAYKIYNRQTGQRRFMPLLLNCIYESEKKGRVICGDKVYYTQTVITKDCIETVAAMHQTDLAKFRYLDNAKGIHKQNGIPFYNNRPASISHHGKFERIIVL